ncbi:MAG TPA: hypothetical protein VJL89_09380 [Thermodesulfovibrionia bacterium]|nr:hypothetical protein [Thermodesulfovibrionia bacterium]
MELKNKVFYNALIIICCFSFLLLSAYSGRCQEPGNPQMPPGNPPMQPDQPGGAMPGTEPPKVESVLSLKVSNNLLTLHAVNASLKSIVEQIGAKLKIDVLVYLRDEQTIITLDFENLDIIKAIVELSDFANFIYYKDAKTGTVKKILVSPKPQKGPGNVQ